MNATTDDRIVMNRRLNRFQIPKVQARCLALQIRPAKLPMPTLFECRWNDNFTLLFVHMADPLAQLIQRNGDAANVVHREKNSMIVSKTDPTANAVLNSIAEVLRLSAEAREFYGRDD